MLEFLNKAFGGRKNEGVIASQEKVILSQDQKAARLTEVEHILSTVATAGIKNHNRSYAEQVEKYSEQDIERLLDERQKLENDLGVPTN